MTTVRRAARVSEQHLWEYDDAGDRDEARCHRCSLMHHEQTIFTGAQTPPLVSPMTYLMSFGCVCLAWWGVMRDLGRMPVWHAFLMHSVMHIRWHQL